MKYILILLPFLVLAQDTGDDVTNLDPIFRQDGFIIPGFDGICNIISSDCTSKSTDCMTARCNSALGNVCYGEGVEYNTPCEEGIYDIDNNLVQVPGVCVEGVCVHVGDQPNCLDGQTVAYRTFPSCGSVGFSTSFRFLDSETFVVLGETEQSFGPDLEHVKVSTAQTIDDPGFGVANIRYLDISYGDCIVGHDPACTISKEGTYTLMGMTIIWQPDSGNAESRESILEIENQTIELKPQFYCDTDACRTSIDMDGTSPTPCGATQLICEDPCKWSVSGFETWPDLNGDYVDRDSPINNYPAYSKINDIQSFAKGSTTNEWWFDDDMADYTTTETDPPVLAVVDVTDGKNPFDIAGAFQAYEIPDPKKDKKLERNIFIQKTCGVDPGPCGAIEGLYSTHQYWSAAYGTVRFTPPDITDAYVKENVNDPYNIALLGDVDVTAEKVEFTVEVSFKGQMAGILVYGSENSYVMCRLDSSTGSPNPATGLSIIRYPNTWVVNGAETWDQKPNEQNTVQRLKITVHEDTVTCYLDRMGEDDVEVPRVTGTYTGTQSGRVGFLTFKAEASFRILGCPEYGTIDPPKPPCIPKGDSSSDSVSADSVSRDSVSADSADVDSVDADSVDAVSADSADGSGFRFRGFDSRDAETRVGDSGDGISDSTSDSVDSVSDSSDSQDSSDDGPSCVPDSSSSSSSDSKDDSLGFDVESAIGVQSESLTEAVLADKFIYVLAFVGFISSLIMLYRCVCTKGDYQIVADPAMEEL